MLEKSTNPYFIFMLTVVSIIIAIVGKNAMQLFGVDVLIFITMLLIILRSFYKHRRTFSNKHLKVLLILIFISFFFDLFLYFNWNTDFKNFFLVYAELIKIGVFVYGWLSTVQILAQTQTVTSRTIILAITAYLFIGIIWSFIYLIIWKIYPQAFHVSVLGEYELKPWNLAMYFSLVTLTTVGYGDILPVSRSVMVLANFEAIAGTIYLTVTMAKLVSLYSTPIR